MPPKVRFNHMVLTFPKGELDKQMRSDINSFYTSVFGWESTDLSVRGESGYLLLQCSDGHALLLGESETPMQAPGADHLGLLYPLRSDIDDLLDKCRRYQERDDRVYIEEYGLEDFGFVRHAFKLKYLLPILFDVLCNETFDGQPEVDHWQYVG
jgi:hypothetical protein